MKETALIVGQYEHEALHRITEALAPLKVEILQPSQKEKIAKALEGAQVAITAIPFSAEMLRCARNLQWLHCTWSGLDGFYTPEIAAMPFAVTNGSGRSTPALAEHALWFMLALSHGACTYTQAQREHRWAEGFSTTALYKHTVGIIGVGSVGRAVAQLCRALQMRVLGYARTPRKDDALFEHVDTQAEGLKRILEESDFVVLTVPLSNETYHMLDQARFAYMKRGAFLVNIARGSVVDEVALLESLRDGRIAGAGLDVFEQEPLPSHSPLWDLPNVLITPHRTAPVMDREKRVVELICRNAYAYVAGERLENRMKSYLAYGNLEENVNED